MTSYERLRKLIEVPEHKIMELKSPVDPNITMFENKEDYLDVLQSGVESIKQYFNSVVDHVIGAVLAKEKFMGESKKYQEEITSLDSTRKIKHDAAIVQCNAINRICKMLDIEPFCDVDTTDRHAVNAFAFAFCMDVFKEGSPHLKDFDQYMDIDCNSVSAKHDLDTYLENLKSKKTISEKIDITNELNAEER